VKLVTLDELWADAETMGRTGLERAMGKPDNDKKYEASITFTTPQGSYISARGRGADPRTALSAATKEARALRAGYEFAAT
jgi:hypothetical protein